MNFKKLAAFAAAAAVGLFFWEASFVYPLKLLTVIFHELGHALAAKSVGGEILRIVINENASGFCEFKMHPTFFRQLYVSSAGYVGSALSGSLLLYVTLKWEKAGRFVLGFLSAALVVVCLLWGRNAFAWVSCLGLAAGLGLAARFLPRDLCQTLSLFIGTFVGLYALSSTRSLVGRVPNAHEVADSEQLAQLTHLPASFWGIAWLVLSVLALGFAVWRGSRHPAAAGAKTGGQQAGARPF